MNTKKNSLASGFWHNVLCVSAITYNFFYIGILTFGLVNISFLQKILDYYNIYESQSTNLYLCIIAALVMNIAAAFGIYKLFYKRLMGYYIYLVSTLLFIILKITIGNFNWYEISLLFIYLLLFSIIRRKYS